MTTRTASLVEAGPAETTDIVPAKSGAVRGGGHYWAKD